MAQVMQASEPMMPLNRQLPARKAEVDDIFFLAAQLNSPTPARVFSAVGACCQASTVALRNARIKESSIEFQIQDNCLG